MGSRGPSFSSACLHGEADDVRSTQNKQAPKICFNIGGRRFWILAETLESQPGTKLSNLSNIVEFWDANYKEYCFDRSSKYFEEVLDFYRIGEIHIPKGVCVSRFLLELEYWDIDSNALKVCLKECTLTAEHVKKTIPAQKLHHQNSCASTFSNASGWKARQKQIWELLDRPSSSPYAKIPLVVYILAGLLSVCTHVLSTHPYFRVSYNQNEIQFINFTFKSIDSPKMAEFLTTVQHPVLNILDLVTMIYLSLDLLARIVFCPTMKEFTASLTNFVDVLCLVCGWTQFTCFYMYVSSVTSLSDINVTTYNTVIYIMLTMRCASILRIFRFLRYTMMTMTGQALFLTIKASWHVTAYLFIFLISLSYLFGSLAYMCELGHPVNMPNIPDAMWWALITMTTVGYGDMVPETVLGRVVGGACAMSGLIITAMAVAMISKNFAAYFESLNAQQKQMAKARRETKRRISDLIRLTPISRSVGDFRI